MDDLSLLERKLICDYRKANQEEQEYLAFLAAELARRHIPDNVIPFAAIPQTS